MLPADGKSPFQSGNLNNLSNVDVDTYQNAMIG